jgi:hypothetical protein
MVLDKLSNSDYFVAAAIFSIKEGQGVDLTDSMTYGREDATQEDAELIVQQKPELGAANYKARLTQLGFD